MADPFQHPAAKKMLERVASAFANNAVWLLPHNQLVFVCGGPTKPRTNSSKSRQASLNSLRRSLAAIISGSTPSLSVRRKFLAWATQNLQGMSFVLAEDAAQDIATHDAPKLLNLSEFEKTLAEFADCVIIFPESVGSWAELGYFSALRKIPEKCLVVNCQSKQGGSFLNDGPIDSINRISAYPKVLVNFLSSKIDFTIVAERLQQYKHRSTRSQIKSLKFDCLTGREKFAIIHYLISIFPSLDIESLILVVRTIFTSYRAGNIRRIVSMLVSVKFVERIPGDEHRFRMRAGTRRLLEVQGISADGLLSEHTQFFQKHQPHLLAG